MRWLFVPFVIGLVACGGKAVFDGPGPGAGGAGGGGGTTTTTHTTTTTTSVTTSTSLTNTTTDCPTLTAELSALITQATTCNACMDYDSCINGPKIHDTCGCQVGASEMAADAAAQAEALYQQWVALGCGPWECDTPCMPNGATYYCTGVGSGCDGRCDAAWGQD